MFDELDRTIVAVVYDHIERSAEKRVTGSTVWNAMALFWTSPQSPSLADSGGW